MCGLMTGRAEVRIGKRNACKTITFLRLLSQQITSFWCQRGKSSDN
jgi:hypothetical protein